MSALTTIEWADHTFNPWWGCARVSPGCVNCYAESLAKRYGHRVWGVGADRRFFGEAHWREPLKWDRKAAEAGERHRVFSGSMADVFEDRNDLATHRERLWELIARTPHLDWLLLTKRPQNIANIAPYGTNWPTNVWLGTTVEDQRRADERLPHLLRHPAAVRFVSAEPLLEAVDLRRYLSGDRCVDWVILGGESGAKARPMQVEWARSVRDQCVEAGVPLHFKQWGHYAQPEGHGEQLVRLRKKGERVLDGRTWDEFPSIITPDGNGVAKLAVPGEVTQ